MKYDTNLRRRRLAAMHMWKTRLPSEEFAPINEFLIHRMNADQLDEYIAFMAQRPERIKAKA